MAKRKGFQVGKEVRKLARERVGPVPPSRRIEPKKKKRRSRAKHPKRERESWQDQLS